MDLSQSRTLVNLHFHECLTSALVGAPKISVFDNPPYHYFSLIRTTQDLVSQRDPMPLSARLAGSSVYFLNEPSPYISLLPSLEDYLSEDRPSADTVRTPKDTLYVTQRLRSGALGSSNQSLSDLHDESVRALLCSTYLLHLP